jgi:hypothetical protein
MIWRIDLINITQGMRSTLQRKIALGISLEPEIDNKSRSCETQKANKEKRCKEIFW